MNQLNTAKRCQIIAALVEGNSINATCRMLGVGKHTVLRLLEDAGCACAAFHDANVRRLRVTRAQCDEVWSFVYAKQKNVTMEQMEQGAGDCWTWTAIDADTKLIISYMLGDRGASTAKAFMQDVASRISNRIQLTTDGHRVYADAVEEAFGSDIDYAMLVKIYGDTGGKTPERKYSPGICTGAIKKQIEGKPNPKHVSTSYVERNNGIIRQHCKRYARLTHAFSKKLENHICAFALHTMYHNFVKISGAHRMTPAQAAGVDSRLWEMGDIVKVVEEWERDN